MSGLHQGSTDRLKILIFHKFFTYPCHNITLFYSKHKKKVEANEIFWLTFLNLIYQVDCRFVSIQQSIFQ